MLVGGLAVALLALPATQVEAQSSRPSNQTTARMDATIWIDPDGCMHWAADGGWEGYMVERVNPETGMPVCLDVNTCLVENTDTLFATDSARLTHRGRARLERFFGQAGAFAYAIYGHTDSRASDEYNIRLSERRAASVASVARSTGARIARQIGYGERMPVAPNDSAANMQRNRRVEVVCYR
ncbi:OmpA family protein [Rhodobacteraceae bacterium WD3A24]|nr:OmpA family protein [Rhodobacteraceae bacterium WD3A24]